MNQDQTPAAPAPGSFSIAYTGLIKDSAGNPIGVVFPGYIPLIAAAPELLAALRDIVACLDDCVSPAPGGVVHARARAVIALAEGRAG